MDLSSGTSCADEHIDILGLGLRDALQLAADMIRMGSYETKCFLLPLFFSAKQAPSMWEASIPAFKVAMEVFRLTDAIPAWAKEDWLCGEELINEHLWACQGLSLNDKCFLFGDLDILPMDPEPHAFMNTFGKLAAQFELNAHVTILCLVEFGKGVCNYLDISREREHLLT